MNHENHSLQDLKRSVEPNELWPNRRFYHKTKGFVNFSLDWNEVGKFYRGIAGVVWSKVTEDRIAMVSSAKYMYILDRLWYNGKRYEYCAGQDYVGEIRHIQNELRKG